VSPFITKLRQHLEQLGITDHVATACIVYLTCASRNMREKLFVLLTGPSSAGKATLLRIVLDLFPESWRFEFSFITKAALLKLRDLRDRILVIQESIHDREIVSAMRQLVSDKQVRSGLCQNGEQINIVLRGPTAILETTTDLQKIDFQKRNRAVVLRVEPTRDEMIRRANRKHQIWKGSSSFSVQKRKIRLWHRKFQRGLSRNLQVNIPFIDQVAYKIYQFQDHSLIDNFIWIVQVIAFLDQSNRKIFMSHDGVPCINATLSDYAQAYELVREATIETGTETFPLKAGELFTELKKHERFKGSKPFTRGEISAVYKKWSYRMLRDYLDILVEHDLVDCKRRGRSLQYLISEHGERIRPDRLSVSCLDTLTHPDDLV